jgi:hypothetical protein
MAHMTAVEYAGLERGRYYVALREGLVRSYANAVVNDKPTAAILAHLNRVNATLPVDNKITRASIVAAVKDRLKDRALDSLGLPDKLKELEAFNEFKRAHGVADP